MTLIEAANSGRRVRMKGNEHYMTPRFLVEDVGLTIETLLSNDWEIEERRVEVSMYELYNAFETAGLNKGGPQFSIVCRVLGLDP